MTCTALTNWYTMMQNNEVTCDPLHNQTKLRTTLQHTNKLHTTLGLGGVFQSFVTLQLARLCRESPVRVTHTTLQHTTEPQGCMKLGGVLQGWCAAWLGSIEGHLCKCCQRWLKWSIMPRLNRQMSGCLTAPTISWTIFDSSNNTL